MSSIPSIPSGAVPAYSYYGVPAFSSRQSQVDGARLAAPSGEYLGRGNLCTADGDTCEGRRAKGTEFCFGHMKKFGLVPKKEVIADADVKVDASPDS